MGQRGCSAMDNIDRMMKEAERLGFGVSYGKYRAAYPNGSADVIAPAVETDLDEENELRACRRCGKKFAITHGNQRYCSVDCSEEAKNKRQQQWGRSQRE